MLLHSFRMPIGVKILIGYLLLLTIPVFIDSILVAQKTQNKIKSDSQMDAGIVGAVEELFSLAVDMETGQRGFGITCEESFPATNRLVLRGPYAYLRNPMVVAGLGQGLGVSVWLGSPLVVVYVLTGGLIWQCLVRPAEERDLSARHGKAYEHYRSKVRCWIPRFSPYRGDTLQE